MAEEQLTDKVQETIRRGQVGRAQVRSEGWFRDKVKEITAKGKEIGRDLLELSGDNFPTQIQTNFTIFIFFFNNIFPPFTNNYNNFINHIAMCKFFK